MQFKTFFMWGLKVGEILKGKSLLSGSSKFIYIYIFDRQDTVQGLVQTRLASSLNGRHSPNALTKVVIFFLGSALARASIIGLRGLEKKRIICQIKINKIDIKIKTPAPRKYFLT